MLNKRYLTKLPLMLIAIAAIVFCASDKALAAATSTILNQDGPNEGFNDPTPVAPVGGNPGTTRGQQRLIAFQFAADLWGATLDSNVEIQLTHFGADPKRPDRNVNVLINPCTLVGTASISFCSPTKNYNISDNNTNVGNCNCTN